MLPSSSSSSPPLPSAQQGQDQHVPTTTALPSDHTITNDQHKAPGDPSLKIGHHQGQQHTYDLKQEYDEQDAVTAATPIESEPAFVVPEQDEPSSHQKQQQQPKKVSWKTKAWDLWMKNWFLLGLIVVIILARYFPEWGRTGGPIRPEYSVKYGITSCIFLLSGLSLKTKDLLISAVNYRAHLLVQLTSFIAIPLIVKAITALIGLSSFNATLLAGMAVTSATPTTISSNVVMTANSDGSESLALFNAALGNLLGVFISPIIVLILLHSTPQTPSGSHGLDYPTILRDLGTTILVPILVGQVYLYFFPKSIAWAKKKVHFPTLNSSCLLILVWTVFCDAFHNNTFSSVTAGEIIAIGALQAFIFWLMTFFLGFIARVRPAKLRILKIMERNQQERERREAQLEDGSSSSNATVERGEDSDSDVTRGLSLPRTPLQRFAEPMSKKDTVAILFCGATKSVAMGIPMIKILYSSETGSALAGLLATPLLIYHVEQLFSGAFMVAWLKKWVNRGEESLESFEKNDRKKLQKQDQDQQDQELQAEELHTTAQQGGPYKAPSLVSSASTSVSVRKNQGTSA
ncbi:SBF-like CPA transporter family-domain-containing protein [Gamsiella multidivaricata]|uniref:SBF-like CPA transporter family-domain-containing protein n=1 Tax=Gamsiella multidivaricata TaxID=101098 RepID=UPI00222129C4|nr:SBF-like CPA transporter family-domain-containing protein [Gamsiella multidivaricata]KAG0366926.1 hypothetical protein BGZ54_004703 [Gamsiella multidivaricata]KAI7820296.1 SBF-like CPA transporter family-domain-containing protein [Gamsiella multidivaricata]